MKFERENPYYNLKYVNEVSNWALSGFSYFWHKEPKEIIRKDNCINKIFMHEDIGVKVTVKETFYEGTGAVRQENSIEKLSDKACVLTQFSSALFGGIPVEEYSDIVVHYTDFAWQTEGQWKKFTLDELGILKGGNHGVYGTKRFSGIGTFSTDKHYPLVILENTKANKAYFFELEASTNWYIEIGINREKVYIEGNCAFENNDGWYLDMKKSDVYCAAPAVFGSIDGGFNEAVNELLKYKRLTSLRGFSNDIPVIFNTYMNCAWCNQSKDKILPIIDSAKKAGADIFCLDSGWHGPMGDWNINEEIYGDMKLQGVIDYIKSLGMKAGVWLEVEACSSEADAYSKYYDAVYKSHGIAIDEARGNMDFRNEAFKEHIASVIDKLYNMGVRYIKNDYNKNSGIGIDGEKCPSYELREANLAFCKFIDEINNKYPDLIIENCGSGAMRCDGNILRYFSLQSTSDLEKYRYYPSVMIGMNACIPPEKAGIWSYPYPMLYENQAKNDNEVFTEEYVKEKNDGSETVFNMVTSMFGCMYLSGRIDKCDEYNFSLIKEGIKVYKSFSSRIKNSYPVFFEYPINTSDSYNTSFGLIDKEAKAMIVGVWNYNGEKIYSIDLSSYDSENFEVRLLYPSDSKICYKVEDKKLNLIFDKNISAAVFEIKF